MKSKKRIRKDVAGRIKKIREGIGLSQDEFAQRVGYTQKFQSAIELGKAAVSLEIAEKICETYNLPLLYLLYGCEQDQAEKQIFRERESPYKSLFDDVREIVESGNINLSNALRANIKAFLSQIRATKEKRRYRRSLFNVHVEVKLLEEPGVPTGAGINGSQMGLLFQTSYEMPKDKEIIFELLFPGETGIQAFRAKGKIIWMDKKSIDDREEFQYGVKFIGVLNDGHTKLESLLHE